MKDRLALFLEAQDMKAGRFAQIMSIQPSNVTHIISGRSKPGFEFISNMLTNFPELNPDWLILGTGDMYRHPKTTNVNKTSEQDSLTLDFPAEIAEEHPSTAEPESETSEKQTTVHTEEKPKNSTERTEDDEIEAIILFHKDGTFSKYRQR